MRHEHNSKIDLSRDQGGGSPMDQFSDVGLETTSKNGFDVRFQIGALDFAYTVGQFEMPSRAFFGRFIFQRLRPNIKCSCNLFLASARARAGRLLWLKTLLKRLQCPLASIRNHQ